MHVVRTRPIRHSARADCRRKAHSPLGHEADGSLAQALCQSDEGLQLFQHLGWHHGGVHSVCAQFAHEGIHYSLHNLDGHILDSIRDRWRLRA